MRGKGFKLFFSLCNRVALGGIHLSRHLKVKTSIHKKYLVDEKLDITWAEWTSSCLFPIT
jgi:hypothetical protein